MRCGVIPPGPPQAGNTTELRPAIDSLALRAELRDQFALTVFFFVVLVFAQLVTVIGVFCLIFVPF